MSEVEVTLRTSLPRTRQSLVSDLLNTSLTPGMTVLVHSSLSSLGWVCGGSVTVVQALMDVITPAGTLVVPTFTGDYSDPSMWQAPPGKEIGVFVYYMRKMNSQKKGRSTFKVASPMELAFG